MPAWNTPRRPGGPGIKIVQLSMPINVQASPNVIAEPSAWVTPHAYASSHMPTALQPQ
jgi:hypothetical protein